MERATHSRQSDSADEDWEGMLLILCLSGTALFKLAGIEGADKAVEWRGDNIIMLRQKIMLKLNQGRSINVGKCTKWQ